MGARLQQAGLDHGDRVQLEPDHLRRDPGQLATTGPETYPRTPQGQKDFLLKCFKDLELVNDGVCIGDIYWDPVFICVPGQGWKNGARNVVANTALFDFDGNALPAFDAYEFND